VQRGPNGLFVYVVGKDNKVRMQKVEDGGESQGQALITSGLQEGESVVVEGQSRIADGALVQPQPEPSPSPSATEAAVTSGQTH
jgi:membrane fusion protein, multidrug efflux system